MPLTIYEIAFESPEYAACCRLRDEVLRRPLGVSLSVADRRGEDRQIHLAAFNGQSNGDVDASEAVPSPHPDGCVVGCVLLKPLDATSVKLRQMAVAPSHQRQGVGTQLVRAAIDWARAAGFATIELHARETALDFYIRLGFAIDGDPFEEVGLPHRAMTQSLAIDEG